MTVHRDDVLAILARGGYLSEGLATAKDKEAKAAQAQALTEFVVIATAVLKAELAQAEEVQHVALEGFSGVTAPGYSLRKPRGLANEQH